MEGVAAAEYSEQQRLTDSDPEQDAMLGAGVALSGDGNTAIVGRTRAGRFEPGVAKVFVRSGTTWTLQQALSSPEPQDPGMRSDWFGGAVALSADGNTAVVGAFADRLDFTYGASNAGSVTIFARSGTTWTVQAHLTCADSDPVCQFGASYLGTVNQAAFGYSVAVSGDGDTVIVGTKQSGSNNVAAVVFTRSGSTWTLQQSIALVGEYTSNHQVQEHKFHGMSVALSSDGNTAAVGDADGASIADWTAVNGTFLGYMCGSGNVYPGAVRVLTRSGSTWTEQQTLVPTGGEARCGFGGYGLDLSDDGNTLIGGAGSGNAYQGSATVFTRSGSTWTQQQTLTSAEGAAGDVFGGVNTHAGYGSSSGPAKAVALSADGNTAVVGAPWADTMSLNSGTAKVFTRSGSTWTQQQTLNQAATSRYFGNSVSLSDDAGTVIAGSYFDTIDGKPDAGSAVVFALNNASVTLSTTSASVSEAGPTAQDFTVVLGDQPSSDVVISVVSADTGEATVAPAQWTFTSSNWDTAQTVTGTGGDDSAVDGTQTTAVTVAVVDGSSDDAYDSVADQTVTVTTSDDDAAGYTLSGTSGTSVTVAEGPFIATVMVPVVLTAQPTSDVVFEVSSADTGEATVSPAQLTFTSSNWSTSQYVTGTGVDDNLTDGNQTTAVTVAVVDASSDNAFDALADQTITVTTSDDDSPGVSVTESDGSTATTESGGTDTFTVVLNTQPSSDVVVSVASSDTGEVTVSPAQLTFTSSNWDTAQAATTTGADDSLVDGPQFATITVAIVDASSDDDYDPVADVTVTVTNVDDEPIPETDCTLEANWNLAECGCPSGQTRTSSSSGTCAATVPDATGPGVALSAVAAQSDAFLSWTPSPTAGVQSHELAWQGPSGSWTTHGTYAGSVIPEDTLLDLANGVHSFQIRTTWTDGTSKLSNVASVTVPTPPPPPSPVPEQVEVAGFDCSTYPSLIQVIGTTGVGHSVKQLDLATGGYSEIFSISVNRTPSYTNLNAIGINPVDGALYGLMRVQGFGYLVRFDDAGNVAFVARVPHMSNAGDVDAQGRFMWDSERTNFYVLSGIADMDGFADPGDAADKSKITPVVTGMDGVADVAALSADLGAGEQSYAMGVNGRNHKLQIWAYDDQPQAWTINLFEGGSPAQLTN